MKRTLLTQDERRLARLICGTDSAVLVLLVPGDDRPRIQGQSFYHTTPGGRPVRYPMAYGYRTVYQPSTRRIEIGEQWDGWDRWRIDRTHGVVSAIEIAAARGREDCSLVPYRAATLAGWLVRRTDGRAYHTRTVGTGGTHLEAIDEARRAWAQQDRETIVRTAQRWDGWSLSALVVTREDARAAGCCEAGVEAFGARHRFGSAAPARRVFGAATKETLQFVYRSIKVAARRASGEIYI